MLLNGLSSHLYGLIEGCHNDAFALEESGLVEECLCHARLPEMSGESQYFWLFGDPVYGLNSQIMSVSKARTN